MKEEREKAKRELEDVGNGGSGEKGDKGDKGFFQSSSHLITQSPEVRRGGKTMRSKLNKIVAALGMAAMMMLGVGVVGKVEAASTDTIRLLVTPGTNLSVKLSSPTPGIGFDFGTITLGNSLISSSGTVVENDGSVSARLMLRGNSLDNWTLQTSTTGLAEDQVGILAVFTSTNTTAVTYSTFTANDYLQEDTNRLAAVGGTYGAGGSDFVSPVPATGTDRRNLWFRITTPPTSSVATQQKFEVWVVAALP